MHAISKRVKIIMLILLLAALALGCSDSDSPAPPPAPQIPSVTFRVTTPVEEPVRDPVYIAGNFQGWNPGHGDYALTRVAESRWEITLDFEEGQNLQYKFTRGSWDSVEKGPEGQEIANRTHVVAAGQETLELTVASWANGTSNSTITGHVEQITVPGFLNERRVWVYLPPAYDDQPDQSYPVLYMLDGQNVFDAVTSFAGEWQVDEALEELIPAGEVSPVIVVAVANGELNRILEYTPWADSQYGGGDGDEHLQAIISVLMPHVNLTYRTLTGPQNTGLAGSSLGGLMALYAGFAHGDTFGRIGSFSPSLWWDEDHMTGWVDDQLRPDLQLYMDMGTRESGSLVDENSNGVDDHIDQLRALQEVLTGMGFVMGEDLLTVEDEGAVHNEAAWADRFPGAMRFLWPGD